MRFKSLLGIAACTAALVGASASAALAGEVKGPPGKPSTDTTPAIPPAGGPTHAQDHANSACVFSGLNDMVDGPTDTIVQTPGKFMQAGLVGPGAPGHGTGIPGFFENGCRGGSN